MIDIYWGWGYPFRVYTYTNVRRWSLAKSIRRILVIAVGFAEIHIGLGGIK